MTLIVGLAGADGTVIGGDSAMTASSGTTYVVDKLVRLPGHSLVAGFSGDESAWQRAEGVLVGPPELPAGVDALRDEIGERVQRAVKPQDGEVSVLIGGVVAGRPLLLTVSRGRVVVCGPSRGWFATIGSYAAAADFLTAPIRRASRTLAENTALTYRVLTDVIAAAPGFVCHPIRLWVVAVGEPEPRQLPDAELARLDARVAAWRARDADRTLVEAAQAGATVLAPSLIDPDGHHPGAGAVRLQQEA